MYSPIIELLNQLYRQYLIFGGKILYRRSFNYDRFMDYIVDERGKYHTNNPFSQDRKVWDDICSQDKDINEIKADKIDFIEAYIKMALILVLMLGLLVLVVVYRINNPLTLNQWLFGVGVK